MKLKLLSSDEKVFILENFGKDCSLKDLEEHEDENEILNLIKLYYISMDAPLWVYRMRCSQILNGQTPNLKGWDNYEISYARLTELATLFKDGLIQDDEETAYEYFIDICDMTEKELEFFEIEIPDLDLEIYDDDLLDEGDY